MAQPKQNHRPSDRHRHIHRHRLRRTQGRTTAAHSAKRGNNLQLSIPQRTRSSYLPVDVLYTLVISQFKSHCHISLDWHVHIRQLTHAPATSGLWIKNRTHLAHLHYLGLDSSWVVVACRVLRLWMRLGHRIIFARPCGVTHTRSHTHDTHTRSHTHDHT